MSDIFNISAMLDCIGHRRFTTTEAKTLLRYACFELGRQDRQKYHADAHVAASGNRQPDDHFRDDVQPSFAKNKKDPKTFDVRDTHSMFESEEKQAAALAAALNTAAGEYAVRVLENGSVSTVELLSSTGAGASPTHTTRHALGLKGIRTGTVMVERKTAFVYIKLHLTERKEVGVATCYARMRTKDGASDGPPIDADQVRWKGGDRNFPAGKSKSASA